MENGLLYVLAFSAMAIALFATVLPQQTWAGIEDAPIVSWTKISVYRSGAQTFGASATTQVLLNAESFDVRNEFDTGTSNFTTTRTGYYHVSASQAWLPTQNNVATQLKLYANDTEVVRVCPGGYTTVSQNLQIGFDRTFYWGNNTVVSLWIYNGQTASFDLYGNGDIRVNWLTIHWIGE